MKWVTNLTWQDAAHLTDQDKADYLKSTSPHERDARIKGLPYLGSGAIYPFSTDDYVIDPIQLADKWPRAFALDVGYIHPTAVVWGAYDTRSDTWYIYSEYRRAQAEVSVHADAILARGNWIKGVVDPACQINVGHNGQEALFRIYERFGIELMKADNSVEPGILEVYQRLSSGRIKIFSPLLNLIAELQIYRRDINGKIVKKGEDLVDALRYLIMSGNQVMELPPIDESDSDVRPPSNPRNQSSITGY